MRNKFLLLTLLLIFATSVVWADTQQLIVWQKSGEKVYFNLADEPETTFESGYLIIKTSKTIVSYPLTQVLRYTYEGDSSTPIIEPTSRPGEMRYMQSDDKMAFDGLADGTLIEVYSLDGKKLFTLNAHEGQRTEVSLSGYPVGTYIVKVGVTTIKFLKR